MLGNKKKIKSIAHLTIWKNFDKKLKRRIIWFFSNLLNNNLISDQPSLTYSKKKTVGYLPFSTSHMYCPYESTNRYNVSQVTVQLVINWTANIHVIHIFSRISAESQCTFTAYLLPMFHSYSWNIFFFF